MKFKVGPAKTKDGKEAIIYAIYEKSIWGIHGAICENGEMEAVQWKLSGHYLPGRYQQKDHRSDLVPNLEPEVYEFQCEWKQGTSGFIYPSALADNYALLEGLVGKRTRVRVEVIE